MTEQQILNRIDNLRAISDVEEVKKAILALDNVHRTIELMNALKHGVLRLAAQEHPLAGKMAAVLV